VGKKLHTKKAMRTPVLLAITVLICLACFTASCSRASNEVPNVKPTPAATASLAQPAASPTETPLVSQSSVPPVPRNKILPPDPNERMKPAEFNGYPYAYRTEATKTVASFAPRPLPADNDLVAAAIRDIIARSYNDKTDATPQLTAPGSDQSIRIKTLTHRYVIVPIYTSDGTIQTLIITQLAD
jgi:hypothetical protein